MRAHLIISTLFFQDLFSAYFQRITSQIVETLVVLSVCHLFGLYNPNQVGTSQRTSVSTSWASESLSRSLSRKVFESPPRVCEGFR